MSVVVSHRKAAPTPQFNVNISGCPGYRRYLWPVLPGDHLALVREPSMIYDNIYELGKKCIIFFWLDEVSHAI